MVVGIPYTLKIEMNGDEVLVLYVIYNGLNHSNQLLPMQGMRCHVCIIHQD